MQARTWLYILLVYAVGALMLLGSLAALPVALADMVAFGALLVCCIIAQLYKFEAPNHAHYYITPVFTFAGAMLLPSPLFIALVAIPSFAEWLKERLLNPTSESLRAWYIQPFNVAVDVIAGITARLCFEALSHPDAPDIVRQALAGPLAAICFLAINHLLIGQAIVLARGKTWAETGALEPESLINDIVLLLLGYVVAVLWVLNPWLILSALSPLLLIYRVLRIPQLEHEAKTDSKTGLYNMRYFTTAFAAEIERAGRYQRPMSLIMADLDYLRTINNTYGHLAGDAVLIGVAKIIRATIRASDIAVRFGGEEFCIVLPETDSDGARVIAERIRETIAATPFTAPSHPTPIAATMSFGVAELTPDAATMNALTHAADVAVYHAKHRGRNRVVCIGELSPDEREIALERKRDERVLTPQP